MAWAQSGLDVVLPFGKIINHKSQKSVTAGQAEIINQDLLDIIKKEKMDLIIIGLPLDLDGKENDNTKRVRKFVEELKKQVKVSIEFVDERFSSRAADVMGGRVSRDERAAMVILETYLERKKNDRR